MCIKKNIDIIDTTVLGMGRGAGNLSTEQMICYLNNKFNNKYDLKKIL